MRTKFSGFLTLLLVLAVQIAFAQTKTVTGTVTGEDGLPIPGVNVIEKGTSNGTQTDFDGYFSVNVATGKTLVFSYLGMKKQEIIVGNQSNIKVTMMVDASELEEVVVTSYQTTTKSKSTLASTTITSKSIEDRANASIVQSIQGQIPGLNIGTSSGQPGANSTVILRGPGSINGNVEPLFVIDGVPVDEDNFRSINQSDIESISVLKDAAATSIYGNRGANGVIVMTTKSGSFNEGMKMSYSSQFGFSELQNLNIELMNSREKLYFQKSLGQGKGSTLTDPQIDALARQNNTYWADYFFRTGTTNNQNLSITSGSENVNSFTSLGYFKQEGTYIASDLQRFSFRNKVTGKTKNDKFNYSTNINLNFSESNFDDGEGVRSTYFNPYAAATQSLPFLSPFDSDGSVTTTGGIPYGSISGITPDLAPYVLLNSASLNTNKDEEIKIIGNVNADYKITEDLILGTNLGVDFTSITNNEILHPQSLLGPFQAQTGAEFGGLERNSYQRDFNFTSNINLAYSTVIDEKHSLDAKIFLEYAKSHLWSFGFTQRGLDSKTLGSGNAFVDGEIVEEINNETARPYVPTVSKTNLETGLFSYFATVNYDYDNKYGVYASIRRDASSRFVEDNQWGTFFSVSGRWNIDEEDFMENTAFNLLKLRASYGTAGNERITGGRFGGLNLTENTYTFGGGYNQSNAYYASNIANIFLRWEETAQTNIGLDFGLWNNKLTGNVDVYNKETTDLFQSRPISAVNATTSINDNIGSMTNKGVEALLNYNIYDDSDWQISVSANASYNKNTIDELAGANDEGIIFEGGSTALAEGQSLGSFYVVEYKGVNPANGNALFLDNQGNLTEDLVDADRKFSDKQQYPVWQGGFGANVSYKNFYVTNQWVWFADIYRNNLELADLEGNANIANSNSAASLLNAWKQPGDITEIPRMNGKFSGVDYINISDRYLEDASYLRLKNITLGYNFDKKTLDKLPFNKLGIYIQGENLVTFSKWRGWDAEGAFTATAVSNYPTPKIYTLGVNVTF